MCDNPDDGGVALDITHEMISDNDISDGSVMEPLGTNRGRKIWAADSYWPDVSSLSENVITFKFKIIFDEIMMTTFSAQSSPFFYTAGTSVIIVINTKKTTMLPTLHPPSLV
ncbi:hypothetical protein PMAYCL1PPCAC_08549 [Pristionchus mayeri]|uniref:Uncharacterized protein n=1 Tax=Pristionchus mayeri TaxID=1317129 RepID=A0AAN4ZF17_9BILA|nr:hypothetical protein PMAYCL1PPCAC_08549 [Pristionchus mayeri]